MIKPLQIDLGLSRNSLNEFNVLVVIMLVKK